MPIFDFPNSLNELAATDPGTHRLILVALE